MSRKTQSKGINGKACMTPETTVRLSVALGDSAWGWLSDFDHLLREEGILEEVTARAHKRLLSLQLSEAMEASKGDVASRIISLS